MLNLFINGIKAANVSNAMVVALDDATDAWLADRQVRLPPPLLASPTGSDRCRSPARMPILATDACEDASQRLVDGLRDRLV